MANPSRRMSAIHLMVDDMSLKFAQDQMKKKPPLVFHPYSKLRNYWDYFLIVLVAYTAAVIPWNVAFQMRDDCSGESTLETDGEELGCMPEAVKALDIFVDVMFWIDILVNFRTAYINNKRHTIRNNNTNTTSLTATTIRTRTDQGKEHNQDQEQ